MPGVVAPRALAASPPLPYFQIVPRDLLPLFPLPVVLFPGAALPLHVFEPRYRQLLADVMTGDRRFGLINLPEQLAERDLPSGTVGCVAEVLNIEGLPDGRSNIMVRGRERFTFLGFSGAAEAAYHVGWTEPYADVAVAPDDRATLYELAERVRASFQRVARAARQLSDDPEPVPAVDDDPAQCAFSIAAMIDLDLEARQALLTSRSPIDRLRRLESVLAPAEEALLSRAEVHVRAKSNGHGARPAP